MTVGSHTYLPETAIASQTPFNSELDPGFAYHRTDGNEGTQTPTGSNGVDGRDETSENFVGTFQMATADPVRPAPPPVGGDAVKLLITEIATTGTAAGVHRDLQSQRQAVDMSDYYLTDAIYSSGGQYYWNIALGNPSQLTVGGGDFFDFHARFPDGFSIGAGDTIVVSVAGSEAFEGHFGFDPHLELFEDGDFGDNIPDMRWVFGDRRQQQSSVAEFDSRSDQRRGNRHPLPLDHRRGQGHRHRRVRLEGPRLHHDQFLLQQDRRNDRWPLLPAGGGDQRIEGFRYGSCFREFLPPDRRQ